MGVQGKPAAKTQKHDQIIRQFALSFPASHEDRPWDHSAYKVKGKTFVFASADETGLGLSVKLKASHAAALKLPYTEPTHYGLGKHGWVSAHFGPKDQVPMDLIQKWIEESFRNIAPKTILKEMDGLGAESVKRTPAKPKPVAKVSKK